MHVLYLLTIGLWIDGLVHLDVYSCDCIWHFKFFEDPISAKASAL